MATRRAALLWIATLLASCAMLALPLVVYAATSAVSIQNSAFAPASIQIKVGDTVTWTNKDAFSHTSTSDAGAWDTGVIRAGASGSFTFMSAGTFAYHCSIHAFMHATIVVQGAATPPPPPPPTQPPAPPPPTPVPTTRTAPPTAAPTETAAEPTPPESPSPTASQSASPSASPVAAAAASPSIVAVAASPTAAPGGGSSAPIIAGAALAIVALTGLAAFLLRRRA